MAEVYNGSTDAVVFCPARARVVPIGERERPARLGYRRIYFPDMWFALLLDKDFHRHRPIHQGVMMYTDPAASEWVTDWGPCVGKSLLSVIDGQMTYADAFWSSHCPVEGWHEYAQGHASGPAMRLPRLHADILAGRTRVVTRAS